MTTYSFRGVIRSDKTADIQNFVLPVQTYPQSEKKENDENGQEERRESPAGPVSRDWTPAGVKEGVLHEGDEILDGAKREAEQLIRESGRMAEDIINDAREQAKQIMRDAADDGYHSGYEDGFKEGVDKAVEEHGKAMASQMEAFKLDMKRALASVEEAKEQCLRAYLEELKDCSVAVAEKVIHISLKSSGEVIKRMIISETERLKKTAWVKIYMEKTEYEMMMETDADIISELSRLSDNIKFIVMDKEESGNCIIEMPEEIIDISVDTQLENIKEILQNIRI